jgi:hypothetical protein
MELFKNTPMDIVNYILSYDSRFKIVQGVAIYVPFTKRHQHIIELLKNKKKLNLVYSTSRFNRHYAWFNFLNDLNLCVDVYNDETPSRYFLANYHCVIYDN